MTKSFLSPILKIGHLENQNLKLQVIAITILVLVFLSVLFAAWAPISFSIWIVFLFAGPHNWFEARYMLGRLPARTGKLLPFFLVSILGIGLLTTLYALAPSFFLSENESDHLAFYYSLWNSFFLIWVATLMYLRSKTNPRKSWDWLPMILFFLLGVNWLLPFWLNLVIVYGHPCMAFWILDRELKRSHSPFRTIYHRLIWIIPILITFLIAELIFAPDLPGADSLTLMISANAGDWLLSGVSSHLLVSIHTFLEMSHYIIWIGIIPLIGLRSLPWNLSSIPFANRGKSSFRFISMILIGGLFVVFALWACFFLDYATTRQVYFSVAIFHVLAEIPFILRMI